MNTINTSNPLSDEEKMLAAGYVLGDLTPEETEQVEQVAAKNPHMLNEIHALQASYELMPQALTLVAPPDHVREKVAEALSLEPLLDKPQPGPIGWLFKVFLGLTTLAALLLAADNARLRYRLVQDMETDRVASILQKPNSRLISLAGNNNNAAGTLLFTPGNWQEVIVSLGDLPPLPPDEVYRMWLALENGEVIYCGEFNTDAGGSVFVRFTPLESPPKGVKTTELFVTIDATDTTPNPSGVRVMEGTI